MTTIDTVINMAIYNTYTTKKPVIIKGSFLEVDGISINMDYISLMEYETDTVSECLKIIAGKEIIRFYERYVEDFYHIKDKVYEYSERKSRSKYCD